MLRMRPTRLLALGALVLVAFLYWKPIHTYEHAKRDLQLRRSEVRSLETANTRLQRKIDRANTEPELMKQARWLGLVRPSEQLFIVRGIAAWRHRNHK